MKKEHCFKAVVGQAMPDIKQGKMFLPKHCQVKPDLHKGFTLIELLVVVLIIGILAAVELPQYKFAVAKARMTQLITLGNSVKQAEERYYLANGRYTTDWSELDIGLTGTISGTYFYSGVGWGAQLSKVWVALWDARITANTNLRLYFMFDNGGSVGKRCYARTDNVLANEICKHFTRRQSSSTESGVWNIYVWND